MIAVESAVQHLELQLCYGDHTSFADKAHGLGLACRRLKAGAAASQKCCICPPATGRDQTQASGKTLYPQKDPMRRRGLQEKHRLFAAYPC